VQVLTDPFGRLLWVWPALSGSTHDLTAARQHGIIEALTDAGLKCWADKAYQGVGGPVRVPVRGRRLKKWKRRHNTTHAKIRCLGERAMATLKGWRLLRKLCCSTNRIADVVKAVLVLHHPSAHELVEQLAFEGEPVAVPRLGFRRGRRPRQDRQPTWASACLSRTPWPPGISCCTSGDAASCGLNQTRSRASWRGRQSPATGTM
jgi:hypothetical protein